MRKKYIMAICFLLSLFLIGCNTEKDTTEKDLQRLSMIKMLQRASNDLDNIYHYIADEFKGLGTAEKMADILENAVLSLDEMPYRGYFI